MKYLKPKSVYNRLGWFLCILEAIMIYVQVIIMIPFAILKPEWVETMEFPLIITVVSYYIAAFPLFILCVNTLDGTSKPDKKRLSVMQFFGLFLITYAIMNVTNFVNIGFTAMFEVVTGRVLEGNLDSVFTEPSILMLVVTVILAPIVEELTFRYFVFNKIRKYGDKAAIITTAVLFGLFHMNFEQFIYATAIGLVFGYIVSKTGYVRYTIMIHMLVNFFGGVGSMYIEKLDHVMVTLVYTAFCYLMILVGVILFFVKVRWVKLEAGTERVQNPVGTAIGNPGMLVFGITCIVLMIVTLVSQIVTALFL